MAQDRSVLDQQLVRFGPNAFVVVNQKKPSDIIQSTLLYHSTAGASEGPKAGRTLASAPTNLLSAFRLTGIN